MIWNSEQNQISSPLRNVSLNFWIQNANGNVHEMVCVYVCVCVRNTYLIQLVTVDLSCLGWHNRMVMVIVRVLLWCDLCLMLIQSNSPTNHSLMDDDLNQLNDPNAFRASHQEYYSPTKIHLGQHTVTHRNWLFFSCLIYMQFANNVFLIKFNYYLFEHLEMREQFLFFISLKM